MPVPIADREEHRHRQQCRRRKPADTRLTSRDHDERCEHGPERRPDIAADLEQRLRQAMATTRRHPCNPRGFGMEDGGTNADERRRKDQHRVAAGTRQQQQSDKCNRHTDSERVGLRPMVGKHPDRRLQYRRDQLRGQRDHSDLREAEPIGVLQHRIERRQQRPHHIVQEMRKAERQKDREDGALRDPAPLAAFRGHANGHNFAPTRPASATALE